ncbi:MAG: GUN4 domain-containing protein [Phormidium sp.]
MTAEFQTPIKVFISYSWDSEEHKNKVLLLANTLRQCGIESMIDRYQQSPPEGWYRWMRNQIKESSFVLVICTEKYERRYWNKEEKEQGLGVIWEGGLIIEELYDGQGDNKKYIPILLSPTDKNYIPHSLKSYTVYRLFDEKYDPKIQGGFQDLYRHLTNQPAVEQPEIREDIIDLPPIQKAPSNLDSDGTIKRVNDSPELEYRRKVEDLVNSIPLSESCDQIFKISKISLETTRKKINLDIEKATEIENDVLQARRKRHEDYIQNCEQYQNTVLENLEAGWTDSDALFAYLKQVQNNLELKDKDAEILFLYAKLNFELKAKNWSAADGTTKDLFLKSANIERPHLGEVTDFQKIPCKDIRKIDKLWTDYSGGQFGCSVQRDIWQKVNGILYDFFVEVQWGYKEDKEDGSYIFVYTQPFKYDINAPKGHLPVFFTWWGGTNETRLAYLNRIQQCCTNVVSS